MGFENAENEQAIRDIYAETRDGNLTEQEQQDIISRYETECQEIHNEACEGLDELHQIMEIFKESLELSGEEISLLQRISGAGVDGVFGPQSFEKFIDYKQSIGFEGGPLQFQQIYQNFQALPRAQRERFQPEGGGDGIFGPNTFRYIVENNLFSDLGVEGNTGNILEDPADKVILERILGDVPEVHTPAEVHYNNGLEMTDEAFEAAKKEILENGENPNYEEFRNAMNQLSLTEKQQFQELVRAEIDGVPGPDTYTHFMYSRLREAGFSLKETINLRKVFSENAEEELQAIRDTYGLDENWPQLDMSETESLPFHITPGMFIDYDVNYGVLTIYDPESGDVITQDVAEGTLDTIGNAFESGNPDEIYTTLERLGNNTERKNEYIAALKEYIQDNESYQTAREFFTRTEQRDGEEIYIVDFRGNRDLIREMVAVDLFGDVLFLKNSGDEYLQFYEPGREFETLDRSSRLTIVDGVELFIPSPLEMEYLVHQEEIRSAVEDNISETLRSGNAQIIRDYFSLPTLKGDQKDQAIWNLKNTVFSERLFANMRTMFAHKLENGEFEFQPKNEFLVQNLTAFDLFGDYTKLESEGEIYTSENSRDYSVAGNSRLSIVDGTLISPLEGSERTEEDYERLNTPLERNRSFVREYVPEGWQEQFMEFVARLPDNEILKPSDPITLADSSRREAMYLVNGEYRTFPVIFGSGGFSDGYIASGDRKTPRGVAHTFSSVRIASSPYGDASNGGSTTVLGASCQNGPLGSQGGGKWFHGVADHRIPGGATWGCVGMNVHIARDFARQIQSNGNRGFGYVA